MRDCRPTRWPGTYLVVVGTGHLVGRQSLIAMLRSAGLQVERVN